MLSSGSSITHNSKVNVIASPSTAEPWKPKRNNWKPKTTASVNRIKRKREEDGEVTYVNPWSAGNAAGKGVSEFLIQMFVSLYNTMIARDNQDVKDSLASIGITTVQDLKTELANIDGSSLNKAKQMLRLAKKYNAISEDFPEIRCLVEIRNFHQHQKLVFIFILFFF